MNRNIKFKMSLIMLCCVFAVNMPVFASENIDEDALVQKVVQQDIATKNETFKEALLNEENVTSYSDDGKLAFFENKETTKIATVKEQEVYKNENTTTFAAVNGHNSRLEYVTGGSVTIAHYYTLDKSNNHFQMLKSTFTYDVSSSKYRFVNVKGGYRLKGTKVSGGVYEPGYTSRNFYDKLVGRTTETIQVNSPLLKYSTNSLHFEILTHTTFTIKDLTNGGTWNKEFGIYSING